MPLVNGQNLQAGINWSSAKNKLKSLLENADINIVQDESTEGFAVSGSMFFARTSAVESLSKIDLNKNLFSDKNSPCDYLIPIVVQNSGYHTVVSCTEQQAFDAYINSVSYLRSIIAACGEHENTCSEIVVDKIITALNYYNNRNKNSTENTNLQSGAIKQKLSNYFKKITKK